MASGFWGLHGGEELRLQGGRASRFDYSYGASINQADAPGRRVTLKSSKPGKLGPCIHFRRGQPGMNFDIQKLQTEILGRMRHCASEEEELEADDVCSDEVSAPLAAVGRLARSARCLYTQELERLQVELMRLERAYFSSVPGGMLKPAL